MRFSKLSLAGVCIVAACAASTGMAQPAATVPVVSPFDQNDPEIQRIKRLDWKSVDLNKLDALHRCAMFYVLQQGLTVMGSKADARLDLLVDYIQAHNLGTALAEASATIPPPPALSFTDVQKMAAAFVATPDGKLRVATQFNDIADSTLPAYTQMYENAARRAFGEVVDSRHQVRLMAIFLEKQGQFDQFKTWAEAEKARRQEAYAAEMAKKRAEAQQAEAARLQQQQQQAEAAQAERQRQQEALAAQEMDYALQQQSQQQNDGGQQNVNYDNDQGWNDNWYPYNNAYYANGIYRAGVRDRSQNAWQNWRRPGQLPARRR